MVEFDRRIPGGCPRNHGLFCLALFSLSLGFGGGTAVCSQPKPADVERSGFYRAVLQDGRFDELSARLVSAVASADGPREMEVLSAVLGTTGDSSLPVLKRLGRQCGLDPAVTGELLWRISIQGALTDAHAALAAELLEDEDPFVRALAEWAIATRVGRDNNGQIVAWPRLDTPDWYRRWSSLPADFLLEADYARLAILCNIHYNSTGSRGSVQN